MPNATVIPVRLYASNGRYIRRATCVKFDDGYEVTFTEQMSKRDAIKQATAIWEAELNRIRSRIVGVDLDKEGNWLVTEKSSQVSPMDEFDIDGDELVESRNACTCRNNQDYCPFCAEGKNR